MSDPTLSDLSQQIREGFQHDERIRALEQQAAATAAVLAEMPRMEDRLVRAIEAIKPKSPWPAVGAIAAALGVILVVAAAIYSR